MDQELEMWLILEHMQGQIADEIRVLLGEAAFPQSLFTDEQRLRRVEAMKLCANQNTTDEERHESWMKMHIDGGWIYGDSFDPTKKIHPNLLPWDQLPPSVKSKARIFDIVAKTGNAIRNDVLND